MRRAGPGDEQRDRPDPLVRIGLGEAPVLQHRHRSPADVVVEPVDCIVDHVRRARPSCRQHRLGRRHHGEGPLHRSGGLMFEEIGVEPAVGREDSLEDQVDCLSGLTGVTEGWFGGFERRQAVAQRLAHQDRRLGAFPLGFDRGE